MTDIEIIRRNPYKKGEKSYPYRYDNNIFEKLNEMNEDIELQNNYKKWKDGINYKTNRKITIGGNIHTKLEYEKFMVNGISFDKLNSINKDEYLEETKKIINEIDIENAIIKDYNKLVDNIIEKIQKLEDWNELVEFEGKYYGIDKVYNNIHRENNCLGEMVFYKEHTYYRFIDRPFCNYEDTEHIDFIYKCNKCNYELIKKYKN